MNIINKIMNINDINRFIAIIEDCSKKLKDIINDREATICYKSQISGVIFSYCC